MLGLCLPLALVLGGWAWGQVAPPQVIHFQGRLTNASGAPVNSTVRDIKVEFYDVNDLAGPTKEGILFGTVTVVDASITNGIYALNLDNADFTAGAETSLSEIFANRTTVWMQVMVGNGSGAGADSAFEDLFPRTQVLAAAYALNSDTLDGLNSTDFASSSSAAPVGASYVTMALDGTLTAERALAAGSGVGLVDGGANGSATLALGALTVSWNQTGPYDIQLNNSSSELYIRDSDSTNWGIFDVGNNTADQTYTFPDASGTVALTSNIPGFATPSLTLGTGNAAGSASTVIRSDATIALFDGSNPAALGTAGPGSVAFAARRDHVHPAIDLTAGGGATYGGQLPLAYGGTAATTAAGARTNLGAAQRQTGSASIPASGWYRIASNGPVTSGGSGGDRAEAMFTVYDTTSSYHSSVTFYASVHFGNNPTLTLLNRSWYGGSGRVRNIRLVEGATYEGAAVEVYIYYDGVTAASVSHSIYHNEHSAGWTPQAFTAGSVPAGFTTTVLNLDTTDPILAAAANTGTDQFYVTRGGVVNVGTGYRVGGGATSGNYLRGNGTNFVSSAIQAGDLPAGSGNYLARNATDTSSAAGAATYLYQFTNSSPTATGGLSVTSSAGYGVYADTAGTYGFYTPDSLYGGGNLNVAGALQTGGVTRISSTGALTATTGSFSGAVTASSTLTVSGTLTANGQVVLGDGVDDIAINSNDWDISSTGVITSATWNGATVTVPYGGTGATTFTSSGVLYGNGTGAILATALGASGTVLTGTGAAPAFSATPTLTSVTAGTFIGDIQVDDTRNDNDAPNVFDREVSFDFKARATVSVPGSGLYSGQITMAPWTDNSGDASHQVNFNEGGIYWRQGQPEGALPGDWGAWYEVWTEGTDGSGSLLDADLLDGLDSTAFAAASGDGDYIQNTTTAQAANYSVSNTGSGSPVARIAATTSGAGNMALLLSQNTALGTILHIDDDDNSTGESGHYAVLLDTQGATQFSVATNGDTTVNGVLSVSSATTGIGLSSIHSGAGSSGIYGQGTSIGVQGYNGTDAGYLGYNGYGVYTNQDMYAASIMRADGGFAVDADANLVVDATARYFYTRNTSTNLFGAVNASGFGIDALNSGDWDLLVYEAQTYTSNLTLGYSGTANLTTYDALEDLTINPLGDLYLTPGGAQTYATDFRPNIIYDRDNTAYYLDPNAAGAVINANTNGLVFTGQMQNLSTWGMNARAQGIIIMPEGSVTDDGAGTITFGSTVIVMNPASGSYIRVAAGAYVLGSWGYLWVNMPPTGVRATQVAPTVSTWADADVAYAGRDRVVLAQRVSNGAIYTRFGVPASVATSQFVPAGMRFFFDSACPAGWTEDTAYQNRILRGHDGDTTYGEIGGVDSHTHTVTAHNHSGVTGTTNLNHQHSYVTGGPSTTQVQNGDGSTSVASSTHTHSGWTGSMADAGFSHSHTLTSVGSSANSATNIPAFREVVVCSIPSGRTTVGSGTIAMFDGPCPSGWSEVAAFQNRVARGHDGDAVFGETGGADTHSHSTVSHTHTTNADGSHSNHTSSFAPTGGPSATGPGASDNFSATYWAGSGSHTHSWSTINASADTAHAVSGDTTATNAVSHLPAFREAVFCQKDATATNGVPPAGTIAIFEGQCPLGWGEVLSFQNRALRGHDAAAPYEETGGADSHSHSVSHSHGGSTANDAGHTHWVNFGGPSSTVYGDSASTQTYSGSGHTHSTTTASFGAHNHTIPVQAPGTSSGGSLAAYREAVFCKKN